MTWLRGLALGAAICGLPYVVYAAEFPPWDFTMIALALAAGGLGIACPADKWLSGVSVGAGILVPIVATIVLDYQRDPTSHNLAPFEILLGLVVGMPPALIGALLGGLTRRVNFRRSLIGGTIAALGLTVAAGHASAMLARTAASESDAKARIKSLIAAQNRYRSANPTRGFACDLNQLGVSFDAPAQRHAPPRQVAGEYGAVTQALKGDYAFRMNCGNEPTPKRSFALFAIPKEREGPGRWVYCAEADGRLRMIKRRSSNHCLTEGRLVLDE